MPGWVLWVLVACAFGIGEMLTRSCFLAPLALGAGLAAVLDVAGAGAVAAWIMFVVVLLLTLGVVRRIVRSRIRREAKIRTAMAALVGKRAIVLEEIANSEGVGCIKLDGEVWTARSLYENQVIEKGTRVEVVEIRGSTALVVE